MSVSLVSVTQPFNLSSEFKGAKVEITNPEDLIVYIARVSNPENQANLKSASKLLKYLISHKHWSPFEFIDVTMRIETERYIAQQLIRHRSFSFQEFSQRYSKSNCVRPIELRKQSKSNRQSSVEEIHDVELRAKVEKSIEQSQQCYEELIKAGVARECARGVLPLSTNSVVYMKGSIRSWIHYLHLRCAEDTQLEHRNVANAIKQILLPLFPNIFST